VKILQAAPGRVTTKAQLEVLGLVAEPDPVYEAPASPFRVSFTNRSQPDYQRCLAGAKLNHSQTGPDISGVDFFYGRLCAQRGWQPHEIAESLMQLSSKANTDGQRYAERTAKNAFDSVMRDKEKSRA
jgi:hypothetical protein